MANNAQKTLVYVILGFLPLVFPVIFTPVYTHYLSIEDYGMLNLFNIISGLLIPFIAIGTDQAFGYLYWDYRDDREGMKTYVAHSLGLILVILVIINALGLMIGPYLIPKIFQNGDRFYFWPFIVSAFMFSSCTVMFRIIQYFYRNREDIRNYSILSIGYLLLSAALSVLMIVGLEWGIDGVILGRTLSIIIVTGIFLFVFIQHFGLKFNKVKNRKMLLYSLPLLFSSVVGVVAYSVDKIIIEEYTSLYLLGIYGFAALVAGMIDIFVNALGNSFIPGIYRILVSNDKLRYFEAQHNLNQMLVLTNVAVTLLIALTAPLMFLLIPARYHIALEYTSVLTLAALPKAFTLYFTQNFYKHKKTLFVLYANLVYLAVIAGSSFPLFHFFGIHGVTYAVLLTSVVNTGFVFIFSSRLDKYRLEIKRALLLSGITFLSVLAIEITKTFFTLHWIADSIPFLLSMFFIVVYFRNEVREYSVKSLLGIKKTTTVRE